MPITKPYMETYLQSLSLSDIPFSRAILSSQGIILKPISEKPKETRITAGYEGGYYYVRCSEGIRLLDLQPLLKNGYKIIGREGLLLKVR